jgi:hypothetical protein
MPVADLAAATLPVVAAAGYSTAKLKHHAADPGAHPPAARRPYGRRFLLRDELAPYDAAELIPKKGDAAMALRVLERRSKCSRRRIHARRPRSRILRGAAESLGIKAGQMFEPIRVAVCGRKTAPPLFGTVEVLGRETCLKRIEGNRETKKQMTPSCQPAPPKFHSRDHPRRSQDQQVRRPGAY